MEPDVSPGFRRREEDGRAGGRDRFMSSVSAVVSTCRPQRTSEGEDVPDDGGDGGADDGRADAGARVGERPPGRPHARSHGGPSVIRTVVPAIVGYVLAPGSAGSA